MITAILIDDDDNLRSGMKSLLSRYAPEIRIIGEADSVANGTTLLMETQPQVVFLDIHLGDGSGFDLLEEVYKNGVKVTAQIIFITAHEQYAIKAFRFSALDF
ncbi:MAG TPA: response regulator, partial [Flavobacterium sp.]|nr:response regulator [Flavobacterium sp.]